MLMSGNIICRDGSTVSCVGNTISVSGSRTGPCGTYRLTGDWLTGPGLFTPIRCTGIEDAISQICGMHGGRMF